MFKDEAFFEKQEIAHISRILRGLYDISIIKDNEDKILHDFIAALDEGCKICCKEDK